jgi:heme oxygenase (mycobilin-producing)
VTAVSGHALVVTRFAVAEQEADRFLARATDALDALANCRGYLRGRLGRAVDDPTAWLMATEWDGVGSYRRALSVYDVRVRASPLLAESRDEPSGFEVLLAGDAAGTVLVSGSDRAPDAATTGPGRAAPPDRQERS